MRDGTTDDGYPFLEPRNDSHKIQSRDADETQKVGTTQCAWKGIQEVSDVIRSARQRVTSLTARPV